MIVICKIPRKPSQKNKYYWKQYYILTFTKYCYDVTVETYYLQPDNPSADSDGYVYGFGENYYNIEYDEEQISYTSYGESTKTLYSFELIEIKYVDEKFETGEIVETTNPNAYQNGVQAPDGYWYELIS